MPVNKKNSPHSEVSSSSLAGHRPDPNRGFSIVTVLISVAVISVGILTYSVAVNNGMLVSKSISSRQQVYELIGSIQNELAGQFNTKVQGITDVTSLVNINVPIGNAANLLFDASYYQTPPTEAEIPADLASLLVRCQANTQVTPTFYHFCLGLKRDPNAASGSIAAAKYGVMELAIKTKNMQTFADITKAAYILPANQNVVGIEVYYAMYWTHTEGKGKLGFHSKKGRYLASKVR